MEKSQTSKTSKRPPPDWPALDTPSSLGPYRLLRPLGRGGMAQVFLAAKYGASGFEKKVAVKTLRVEHRGDAVLERLLIEEAKMGARLVHQNLIQVHDLGVDQGIYYVCMDYIDGVDLASILKSRVRLTVVQALTIVEAVARGLEYVHVLTDDEGRPLGLVHRDISPSNILISRFGEVKLSDFGIAKATLLSDVTWGRFRKGKIAYMSPEQIAGETLTQHSDQFGLGVVLMELIWGRRPFDGETPLETMDRIRAAKLPKLSKIPRRVRPIIRTALKRDPADRHLDIRGMRRRLTDVRKRYPLLDPTDLSRLTQLDE